MNSLIDQIADYLDYNNYGTKNDNIHPGQMPDSPDSIITIRNTGGESPHTEVPISYPGFQVITRAATEPNAEENAWKIYKLFNRKHQLQLVKDGEEGEEGEEGERLVLRYCYAQAPPQSMGEDDNRRVLYTTNYVVSIDENQLL